MSWSRARRAAAVVTVLLATTVACTFGQPDDEEQGQPPKLPSPSVSPSPSEEAEGDDGVGVQVLVRNLQTPWGVAFLPDGTALVTERGTRRILKVTAGGTITPVQTIQEAYAVGEGGLLGIAVSPKYATDKTVFIYYTTRTDNRIAALVLGAVPKPIVTGIPAAATHNGGRLAFGPDGWLYASTGDATLRANAQNPTSLGGKILRMTGAGGPAPGNPIPKSLVWSLGHRNVQGLAWDAKKRLYATEFGQNTWDELNLIAPGKNYGWPTVEGKSADKRYVAPLAVWPPAEASPSGVAVAGNIVVLAGLRGQRLWLVPTNAATGAVAGAPQAQLVQKFGRLRTVVVAPDKSLWVTTSNRERPGTGAPEDDRIIRIIPPGSSGVSVL